MTIYTRTLGYKEHVCQITAKSVDVYYGYHQASQNHLLIPPPLILSLPVSAEFYRQPVLPIRFYVTLNQSRHKEEASQSFLVPLVKLFRC